MSKSVKYFHELRLEERKWLVAEGTTRGELEQDFPQPPWCNLPNALRGAMGCWSLLGVGDLWRVTKEDDCKECPVYQEVKDA